MSIILPFMRAASFVVLGIVVGMVIACGPEADECGSGTCVRTVFVSEAAMSADLGGIAGADAICATEAAAAGLEGTFLAWLSDATHSPEDRFPRSAGPYVLPDGTQVLEGWTVLVDGLSARIAQHADGTVVPPDDGPPALVWTGTFADGQRDDVNRSSYCGDWTLDTADESVLVGWVHEHLLPGDWSAANVVRCASQAHLYCFQR